MKVFVTNVVSDVVLRTIIEKLNVQKLQVRDERTMDMGSYAKASLWWNARRFWD